MKLLSCHIENFGIFSDFDFTFEEGLTVLYEENGYGKSTLAAFLKAMLYGFPRTGARNITENERKRYDPWQGGKYGGYLEFETADITYRVTRYFGKTAAKDSFALYDLTNRQESVRFSEKLGEELFQLDAASFARSTYLAQSFLGETEATTSIRAKLSDLVDDTNDLNNYDTAFKALRDYRTRFRAYRGDGGRIHELEEQYHEVERHKFEAEQQRAWLSNVTAEIEKIKLEKTGNSKALQEVRKKHQLAAARESRRLWQSRMDEFAQERKICDEELNDLETRYPAGCPTTEEVQEQRKVCRLLQQAAERLESLKIDAKDREILEREQGCFEDTEKTAADIRSCDRKLRELEAAKARLSAQLLPEEREELLRLSDRFADGIPTDETLQTCIHAAEELEILKRSREEASFSAEDEEKYRSLQRLFAEGVPAEEEIRQHQENCQRITELQGKKKAKTTRVQETAVPGETKTSKAPFLSAIFGAILIAVGLVFFLQNAFAPGAVLVVLGFGALLGAVWLYTKSLVSAEKQKQTSVVTVSAITDEENQKLYDLQHELRDFLLRFYREAADPVGQLVQLQIDRKAYLDLCIQREKAEEKRKEKEKQMEAYRRQILPILRKYASAVLSEDLKGEIRRLSEETKTYRELKAKEEAVRENYAAELARAEELEKDIEKLLDAYRARELGWSADACLLKLRERAAAYQQAAERVSRYRQEKEQTNAKLSQLRVLLDAFFKKYQLSGAEPEQLLERIREDLRKREEAGRRLSEIERKQQDFLLQNPKASEDLESEESPEEELPDIYALEQEEQEIQEKLDTLEASLNALRQKRKGLRENVERIPDWQDEMARLSMEREECIRSCELTDRTLELLSEAKDRLANNYVGKVEQRFGDYAKNLLGERLGKSIVDKDLKLTIDEKGDAREVASFSAGMRDCIALCMRLSLVDALFEEEKPFLILDDPFVNLDDVHTKRALEILEELSRDHQIIYLVCNSSRI